MGYSASQLRMMIIEARALGFTDDVRHWTAELAKLEAKADKDSR